MFVYTTNDAGCKYSFNIKYTFNEVFFDLVFIVLTIVRSSDQYNHCVRSCCK